jgi:hypothetical protein
MSGTWNFCPNGLVVKNKPPKESGVSINMNGWNFGAKSTQPYQMSFSVTMHGLTWFLQTNGLYDVTTSPTVNARLFEQFVQAHGTWDPFVFPHPHLGNINARFENLPEVPEGIPNSGGLIAAFEVNLIHHDPAYS